MFYIFPVKINENLIFFGYTAPLVFSWSFSGHASSSVIMLSWADRPTLDKEQSLIIITDMIML